MLRRPLPRVRPPSFVTVLRLAAALAAAVAWSGCIRPPPAAEGASDAARELNVSSRFGEISGVLGLTAPSMREQFLNRRTHWGKAIRVVDVELAGMTVPDNEHAAVAVDFSWTRTDEGTLRTTRVLQNWENTQGSWLLVRERRLSGDLGLFGEVVQAPQSEPRPDVQFATKVIR
jgi:hypothetical protein